MVPSTGTERRGPSGEDDLTVLLLAGGRGTRVASIAGDLPKHLLPVSGEPFAALQLRWLETQGVRRVIYCVGVGADRIEAFVVHHGPSSIDFQFLRDGERLLGTGGAIRRAHDVMQFRQDVLVLYGDTLLTIDLADLMRTHRDRGLAATMAVYRNGGRFDTSNAEFDGARVCYRKVRPGDEAPPLPMAWIDYGVSALSPAALDRMPPGRAFDLAELFEQLGDEGQLGGYEATERFFEIGTPAALQELETLVRRSSSLAPGAAPYAR